MPAAPISSTSSSPADYSPASVALSELEPGATAVIDQVAAGAATRRLQDLGLLPRTQIRVLRRAPLGDPVEYELRGYRLCLRRCDAARVRVRPLTGGSASAR